MEIQASALTPDHGLEPLVVSPKIAWRLLGCGNTRGYELIATGELESYKDGKSRRITMASIRAHIARKLRDPDVSPNLTARRPQSA
jgi:excisionase family DNA binding protein